MTDNSAAGNEKKPWFRHETVMKLFHEGAVVDGRRGGLIIGRSHAEGNIYLVQQAEPDRYEIHTSVEGGEYLLSHVATIKHFERISEINSWTGNSRSLSAIPISNSTRIINTTSEPGDKTILIDHRGQFVINKNATVRFYDEIERLNHEAGDFTDFRLNICEVA